MAQIKKIPGFAVLAPNERMPQLKSELQYRGLSKNIDLYQDLIWCKEKLPSYDLYWQQNMWLDLHLVHFTSIKDCADALRSFQRNWWPYLFCELSRGKYIQEALPHVSGRPLISGASLNQTNLGSFTLLDKNTALFSPLCTSQRPNGTWEFNEDKINPPSRAYLKLWEVFSRFSTKPQKGDYCLELGASPGGWTWVLRELGATVFAFDRSPLIEKLMRDPLVHFEKKDAFSVTPSDYPKAQWLFSDVICYPEKLYEYIDKHIFQNKNSSIKHAVCTIKLQGETDYTLVDRFRALPNSKVIHLTNNKHELTWIFGL